MSDTSSLCSEDVATLSATNWEAIQQCVSLALDAKVMSWGETKSGGFNLIRFLRVDGNPDVVVRVPLNHVEDPETAVHNTVAAMQYFHEQTTVPLPRIICYSTSSEEAGRPYVVTTKAEGVTLVEIWDDLSDHRRDVILRQVVQLVLEMYSQRFDKIGSLSRELGAHGKWGIQASPTSQRVYTSGTGYWIDHATGRLATILAEAGPNAIYEYAHVWWMRSLIPSLYDDSLDTDGFPLMHGDFHSQNIFIVDADSDEPRISSIIDWDFTRTLCTSSFAQPPFFIVDHPLADPDDEQTQAMAGRNARDREVYTRLVREEEVKRFPNRTPRLSQALLNWEGVYLFEQCIDGGVMYSALWDTLVEHVVGDKAALHDYIFPLIETGILKSVAGELKEKEKIKHSDLVDSNNE
ncbi:hypothetical protein BDZ89DRAFT_1076750 [Hymenopellis radicata]|nr:hypothetical protein BDZ89DRAFT_1076750 [Hymenopellis radicata]